MEVQAIDPHDMVRVLERPVDVAVVIDAVPGDIRSDLVMQDRRVGLRGRDGIDDDRQRLVDDVHELGGVARHVG